MRLGIAKMKVRACLQCLAVALSLAQLSGLALAQASPGLAPSASYDAIIASARAGAHAQAIEALRAWQLNHPQDKRVSSDLVVVMGWAGQDAQALASAKASGSAALEPYALRSAAKSARNQQDHAWALEAYTKLYAQDAQDCDALLGMANSQVDLRQSEAAGNALTQLEACCVNAQGWPERLAQARSYWAARQKNTAEPRDLAALAWWSDQMNNPQASANYPVAYRNARVREAVLVASRTGSHQLARTWLAQAEPTMSAEERASVLAAIQAQRSSRQIRCSYDANHQIQCDY
jgi:hypothetical protein